MPYVYVYECRRCRFDLEIVLSREFRREADGTRVDFEYPAEGLVEWPPRRVAGLWSRLWCPACRELRPHVLIELDEPAEHPVQAFLAAEARGLTGGETGPCPECGAELQIDVEDAPCPRCDEGTLALLGEYEP
ncbi:MAG: hypothetical protein ACK47B_09055 [Armatimonadota bacterium]